MSNMKTYTVLSPLKSGGKKIAPGKPVNLSPDSEDTLELIALGIVAEGAPKEQPAEGNSGEAGVDGESLQAELAGVFDTLTDADFTTKEPKRPLVKSVEKALKGKIAPDVITPELVEAAWAAYTAAAEADKKKD